MTTIHAVFFGDPDRYPPIINGVRLLAAGEFIAEVFCSTAYEPVELEYPQRVLIHRIGREVSTSWQKYVSFVASVLTRSHKAADLFIGHDMHGLLVARLLSWRYGRPLVYHCHEYVDSERGKQLNFGGRLVFRFQRYFAKTADLVVVPDLDRANLMIDEFRLTNAPLVVTNSPMHVATASGKRLQAELNKTGRSFEKIVFRQGSIGPSHAIETTLQSMPLWSNPAWGFVIMGLGAADYIRGLQQQALELGVSGQFAVLPPVSYDEVMEFTTGANVGHSLYSPIDANNRYSTTASNKLMEYMAAGLPLLASDRPGLRALVERYDCGLTADESDPASIAAAVNTLLGDPQRACQMGANGTRAFEEEFRYDKQFAPVLAAIAEMATRRRS